MSKKVFISFPYNDRDSNIVNLRVKAASAYALVLKNKFEYTPFAPAVMGHYMLRDYIDLYPEDSLHDLSFAAWRNMCYEYLDVCDELHVLKIEGWQKSSGVLAEIERAESRGIKVFYV